MSKGARLQVVVKSSRQTLARDCIHANTSYSRLVGLLNHDSLPEGQGLLLEPCNHVHMFFMKFGIDAVFLAKDNSVVGIAELKPWRVSKIHFKARRVLELPLGTCRKLNLRLGEILEVIPC